VGEGADELFFGYEHWKTLYQLQKLANWPGTHFIKQIASGLLFAKRKTLYYEYLRRSVAGHPVFWGGAEGFTETEKKEILSSRLRRNFKNYSSWEAIKPIYERFQQRAWEKSLLHWMTYLDLNMRLPELLLMRVDKMSMGVSLEARVPFLDYKFVELILSIPEKIKIKNGVLKYILKKSVSGLIPDEIINRPKQGFGVPIYEWFFTKLGSQMKHQLNKFCSETDLLEKKAVSTLVEKSNNFNKTWQLYNFVLWWEKYF